MSTQPTNVADEALRLASQALMFTGNRTESGPVNTEASVVKALAAQALATLALAKEQRTANLLALAALDQSHSYGAPRRELLLTQVRDRLGVTS